MLMLLKSPFVCFSMLSITSRFKGCKSKCTMPFEWIWCRLKRRSLAMTWMSPRLSGLPLVIRYSNRLGGREGILICSSC